MLSADAVGELEEVGRIYCGGGGLEEGLIAEAEAGRMCCDWMIGLILLAETMLLLLLTTDVTVGEGRLGAGGDITLT
jgi:hypothetical protein